MRKFLLVSLCGFACVANAKEIELKVESGEQTFDAALTASGQTLESGDTVVKTGEGTLTATATYKDLMYLTRVSEGVYSVGVAGGLGKDGNHIRVKKGASLVVKYGGTIGKNFQFWLEGDGHSSLKEKAGAMSFQSSYFEVFSSCGFNLDQGDATLYSSVGHSSNGPFTYGRWNLYGHKLTLKGNASSSGFRFRYASSDNTLSGGTTGIVIDNCWLSHGGGGTFKKDAKSYVVTLKNGGQIGPENQSFMDLFAELLFDPGTGMANSGSNNAITLPAITGFPSINDDITPTVNKRWTLRATDLATNVNLTAVKALTFGSGAFLDLQNGCLASLDAGTTRKLATSSVSITGLPKLSLPPDCSPNWKLALSSDTKTLTLMYDTAKIPAGVVNVRDWGVLPGADKAAANTAAFNQGLAALGDQATVFFPQGEYYFDAPLAVGGKTGLTLLGDNQAATIRVTDDVATSVLAANGGANLTVTDLTLAGGAGVAVAAADASGLTVTNNAFRDIKGVIADVTGAYPVSAVGCTGTFVRDNFVLDGVTYDALAHVSGGSVVPGSEPQTTNVYITVGQGYTEDFAVAFARTGLKGYPANAQLVKRGAGTLIGTNNVTSATGDALIKGVRVEQGVFSAKFDDEFGVSNQFVYVCSGATLSLPVRENGVCAIKNRTITFSGTGCDGRGAIEVLKASWQVGANLTLRLDGDATIDARGITGQSGFMSSPYVYLNNHTLTLKGDYPSNGSDFRWRETGVIKSGGTIVCDSLNMSASYGWSANSFRGEGDGTNVTLKVENGSYVNLSAPHLLNMYKRVEWNDGKLSVNYDATHDLKTAAFRTVVGVPTSYTSSTSVTVTDVSEALVARAADLVAGKWFKVPLGLSFGANAVIEVEGIDDLPRYDENGEPKVYTVASGASSLLGKPGKGASLVGKHWRVFVEDKAVKIAPVDGLTLLIR